MEDRLVCLCFVIEHSSWVTILCSTYRDRTTSLVGYWISPEFFDNGHTNPVLSAFVVNELQPTIDVTPFLVFQHSQCINSAGDWHSVAISSQHRQMRRSVINSSFRESSVVARVLRSGVVGDLRLHGHRVLVWCQVTHDLTTWRDGTSPHWIWHDVRSMSVAHGTDLCIGTSIKGTSKRTRFS